MKVHQSFQQREKKPWDIPDEMEKFTKTQLGIFNEQNQLLKKVRAEPEYRRENVKEVQLGQINVLSKQIFGMQNELLDGQVNLMKKIH